MVRHKQSDAAGRSGIFSLSNDAVAPPVAVHRSPLRDQLGVSTRPRFSWYGAWSSASYRLQVSTTQDFSTLAVDKGSLTSTDYEVTAADELDSNVTYYWRVLTIANGDTTSSAPWSFRTWTGERTISRVYYVKDHLGSVRASVNENGTDVHADDFYPFGLRMPKRSQDADAPKENFTGHELDDETGLLYAGARYLDPATGRWMSVDPLARNYPGWSPYHYAGNSPVLIYDPDGKDWSIVKEVDEDGNITYNIHVRMAIYNSSDSKLNMEALRDATVQQIVGAFSFNQYSDVCTTAITTVDARVVSGMREVEPHEHLLEVTNSLPENAAGMAPFGGMRMYITPDVAESAISGSNVRTIAHELGHTGRLYHPNSPDAPLQQQMSTAAGVNNVMFQAVTAAQMGFPASQTTTINARQTRALHNYYTRGHLNRNNNFVFPSVLGRSIPRQPGIFPWIRR
jgi:RHS repeat-associated protein